MVSARKSLKNLKEIIERLGFLVNVGLNYLSLSRSAETLSGGGSATYPSGEPRSVPVWLV